MEEKKTHAVWTESCPSKVHVAALSPSVNVSGDGAFKEVIKVTGGHEGGLQSNRTGVLYREGQQG